MLVDNIVSPTETCKIKMEEHAIFGHLLGEKVNKKNPRKWPNGEEKA